MIDTEFDKDSWFKLTEEEQNDYIKDVIVKSVEGNDLSVFYVAEELIPNFIEKEEYEIADLLKKISLKLKTHGV